jgi:hypothetical protein
MPGFDPSNPFPLVDPAQTSAGAAQDHAERVDAWLGLDVEATERRILARQPEAGLQTWAQLGPRVFQTPYLELRALLENLALPEGGRIIDCGAGYARLAFVLHALDPSAQYLGYECVPERVAAARAALAQRGCSNAQLELADIGAASFRLPKAAAYFIYDYGTRAHIEKTLGELRAIAADQSIQVAARGRLSRDLIERGEPWLSQVHAPRHFGPYSIYRS